MFEKILIANRGEIACRVMETAKQLGVATVAVYSEADAAAPHARLADEAVFIGPAAPAESYLKIEKILDAAKRTGAQAVHPGYGFLSENADFAEACASAGVVFIGPKPDTIRAMGSKSRAKDMMSAAGVPVTPGYQGEDQSLKVFLREAERIGYPALLKATAGGGGKGMRLVHKADELEAALDSAKREALSAFGDDRFLIEKYIGSPRHVEVQIFGDSFGNVVHLYERDCSVQRRHQKIIEEAPAPNLPEDARARLHDAAVKAGQAVDYIGAGTVEFLYDGGENVYFMEMNTRLQVEHPVTEMVVGEDLVEWQLRVASGEELPLDQHEIECLGHAFEARLYAEDPAKNFMPSTGNLERLALPEHIARVDSGVAEGGTVSPNYDPMIAKIVTHGADRTEGLMRLRRALEATRVAGLETNAAFLHALSDHDAFKAAEIDTHFIERHGEALFAAPARDDRALAAACLWLMELRRDEILLDAGDPFSPWASLDGWRMNRPARELVWTTLDGALTRIRAERENGALRLLIGEDEREIRVGGEVEDDGAVRLFIDGQTVDVFVAEHKGGLRVWIGADHWDVGVGDPFAVDSAHAAAEGSLAAPMPGVVTALKAEPGAKVDAGAMLLVMEAMKMEYAVHAPSEGVVKAFLFAPGDTVGEGDLLVEFEETE